MAVRHQTDLFHQKIHFVVKSIETFWTFDSQVQVFVGQCQSLQRKTIEWDENWEALDKSETLQTEEHPKDLNNTKQGYFQKAILLICVWNSTKER